MVASILPLNDSLTNLHRIFWPSPIVFEKNEASAYSVMPIMQGCLVENGSDEEIDLMERWEFEADYTYTRANTMHGGGRLKIVKDIWQLLTLLFDAGVDFYHKKGGCSRSAVKWHSQLGKIGYRRECTYYTFSDCDYNTFCKTYREYLIEKRRIVYIGRENYKESKCEKNWLAAVCFTVEFAEISKRAPSHIRQPRQNPGIQLWHFDEMGNKIKKIKAEGLEKVLYILMDG